MDVSHSFSRCAASSAAAIESSPLEINGVSSETPVSLLYSDSHRTIDRLTAVTPVRFLSTSVSFRIPRQRLLHTTGSEPFSYNSRQACLCIFPLLVFGTED